MFEIIHLQQSAYETRPWKNGKGVTTDVCLLPEGSGHDDFDFRVSLAPISNDGAFSSFDGIDRYIIMIEGVGLSLIFDESNVGYSLNLECHQTQHFDSGLAPVAHLVDGAVKVINIMARRTHWKIDACEVARDSIDTFEPGDRFFFFSIKGCWKVSADGESVVINPYDSVLVNNARAIGFVPLGDHGVDERAVSEAIGLYARLSICSG